MFDAHCHLHRVPNPHAALFRARAAGVLGFALAGTHPDGWDSQAALAAVHPDVVFSIGLHPWWVAASSDDAVEAGLAALERRLAEGFEVSGGGEPVRPWAVGEIGLDRSQRIPKELHPRLDRVFEAQLRLASEHELPVVLHIVRHHGRAEQLLRTVRRRTPGLVHGFTGTVEVALAYERLGLHISFGTKLLDPDVRRARRSAAQVRRRRLLVETDAGGGEPPDPGDPFALSLIAHEVAEARSAPPTGSSTT